MIKLFWNTGYVFKRQFSPKCKIERFSMLSIFELDWEKLGTERRKKEKVKDWYKKLELGECTKTWKEKWNKENVKENNRILWKNGKMETNKM